MGIGLIRTLLAISVVLTHSCPICGYNVADGMIAVECFFIISGFYMALILNEKYVGPGSTWMFYSNRFLKLYPVYWLVLLLMVVIAASSAGCYGAKGSFCLQSWLKHGVQLSLFQKTYLIAANLLLFGQDAAYLVKFNFANGLFSLTTDCWADKWPVPTFLLIPPAWTLGTELLFYCVAPIIVRQKPARLLALVALSLSLRVVFVRAGYYNTWDYRFFPLQLAFFCAGGYAYTIYRELEGLSAAALGPARRDVRHDRLSAGVQLPSRRQGGAAVVSLRRTDVRTAVHIPIFEVQARRSVSRRAFLSGLHLPHPDLLCRAEILRQRFRVWTLGGRGDACRRYRPVRWFSKTDRAISAAATSWRLRQASAASVS